MSTPKTLAFFPSLNEFQSDNESPFCSDLKPKGPGIGQ